MKLIIRLSTKILLFISIHSCKKDDIVPPTLTTTPIPGITKTYAISGGTFINEGGPILSRGVCWSESTNPSTSDRCTNDSYGIKPFTSEMKGLSLTERKTYRNHTYCHLDKGSGSDERVLYPLFQRSQQ